MLAITADQSRIFLYANVTCSSKEWTCSLLMAGAFWPRRYDLLEACLRADLRRRRRREPFAGSDVVFGSARQSECYEAPSRERQRVPAPGCTGRTLRCASRIPGRADSGSFQETSLYDGSAQGACLSFYTSRFHIPPYSIECPPLVMSIVARTNNVTPFLQVI